MALQHYQDTPTIGFKSVQLLKTQTLGIGSYGSVCKALCDDLLCAAKIIHQTLVDPNAQQQIESHREHRLPINRFMQECEFMSAIRHPNIVQYLGTHQDLQTGLPVLLMELMDDSLTHFLESSQDAVPYHIQVKFCHDITLAISYLHSNEIIHRDLSSNNVLLRGNVQAKVTDFGMAKLGDINPEATRISATMCPGTDVYMPPETVQVPPVSTAKIDCFAIGALIIQILTRRFPEPGSRLKLIHTTDPRFPTIEARALEVERRQNHISQVDPNHPLLPIALDCLKDSDVDRPSAQELCDRVAALKETPQFTESVRRAQETPEQSRVTEREEEIGELRQQVQDKDDENRQLRQEHARQIQGLQQIIGTQNKRQQDDNQQLRETIEEKDTLLQRVHQQLEFSQQLTVQYQTRIQELEQHQQFKTKSHTEPLAQLHPSFGADRTRPASFTLNWKEAKKAPCMMHMYKVHHAIVHGNMVYFMARTFNQDIYAYDSNNDTWDQLPGSKIGACSLAVVNNLLTIIGGKRSDGNVTNKLFSFLTENKAWEEVFQSMPTKRSSSIVLSIRQALIVAGGVGQGGQTLKKVEIMDLSTQNWSSASDLPIPLSHALLTICQDRVYLVGGFVNSGAFTKTVYTSTLSDLFKSCQSRSLGERLTQSLSLSSPVARSDSIAVWDKVADLPIFRPTCVTLYGRLLAIGGCDSENIPTSDVYIYHPTSNTWEAISKMQKRRCWCFAAFLPFTNKVMVVGGLTNSGHSTLSATDSIEIATIV